MTTRTRKKNPKTDKTLILSIETSCDDTCVCLYEAQAGVVLSNIIYSQDHTKFGGILPEYAARNHLNYIYDLTNCTLNEAKISANDVDIVAATYAPGLVGSLMIGLSFAKGIAWAADKKFIGVHHIEGHILSAKYACDLAFPYGAMVVSGGHTLICIAHGLGKYEILGRSLDDAVGECFDKVAREIGLGQPGGPKIEALAKNVAPHIKLPIPLRNDGSCNFSLSGLKTAAISVYDGTNAAQVASSLQNTIAKHLLERLKNALQKTGIRDWAIVGGVAANQYIKEMLMKESGAIIHCPPMKLCTDNALMIAYTASLYAEKGVYSDLGLGVMGKLPLSDLKNFEKGY